MASFLMFVLESVERALDCEADCGLLHHELCLLQEKEATSYLEPDFDPYARSWL